MQHVIVMPLSTCTCHAEKSTAGKLTAGKLEDRVVRGLDNLIPGLVYLRNNEVGFYNHSSIYVHFRVEIDAISQ